ncbi:hypothetical protein B2J88_02130 [Rhodococcus sp. SRB_17]|uniref:hypothetical protein n=1 Tax=Rhodococcus sp. OK302 TaxID=1882769 RepID=UPI000B945DE0|nr:hypothetical protein [Rhodococcus sp. OK302]NMM83177.1 hypothetical protein [Rhodococcus sp. SRB_17]OYD70841.1 hypothetical protein BDB13_4483 [Rhodococcus sp. OK302]
MTTQGISGDDSSQKRRSGAAQRAYDKRMARTVGRTSTGSESGFSTSRTGEFKARIPFVASIIGLFSIGLAVTLLLTTRSAEDSYQLSDARAFNQSLVEQKAALERDYQSRNSAPELANAANALGMVPAKDPARLVVHPDGTVEVVGTPAPASAAPMPPLDAPVPAPVVPRTSGAPTTVPRTTVPKTTVPVPPAATPGVPNNPQNLAHGEQLVAVTSAPALPTSAAVPTPTEDRR